VRLEALEAPALPSSPIELFETAAGLPLVLTLVVLVLHLTCCSTQYVLGSDPFAADAANPETPRHMMREALARGGLKPEEAPLTKPEEAPLTSHRPSHLHTS
jgi:hypothetical protein